MKVAHRILVLEKHAHHHTSRCDFATSWSPPTLPGRPNLAVRSLADERQAHVLAREARQDAVRGRQVDGEERRVVEEHLELQQGAARGGPVDALHVGTKNGAVS